MTKLNKLIGKWMKFNICTLELKFARKQKNNIYKVIANFTNKLKVWKK